MSFAGLSLRDLEYVVALADELHFGRAAERCAVSQPALSGQIRKVEDLLGTVMFERSSKRVLLTPSGQVLVRQIRLILAEAQRLMEMSHSWTEPLTGTFRLGAIATLGPYLFPSILRPLRDRLPKLELILHEGRTAELLESLRTGVLDAALVSPPVDGAGLRLAPLFFEPFVVIHPWDHPLAGSGAIAVSSLSEDGLVMLDEGHCLRDQTLALCGQGAGAIQRIHATSLETLRHMVAAGAGYALIPALAAEGGSTLGGLLSYRPFADANVGRTVALAWRESSPRTAEFELLASILRKIAPPNVEPLSGEQEAEASSPRPEEPETADRSGPPA